MRPIFILSVAFSTAFFSISAVASDSAMLPENQLMDSAVFTAAATPKLTAEWITSFGFHWNDQQKKTFFWNPKRGKPIQIFGKSPVESVLTFDEKGKMISAEFSLWNDGDCPPMEFADFKTLASDIAKSIQTLTGIKPLLRKDSPKGQTFYDFDCGDRYWRILCGFRDDRKKSPQFIKVMIRPKETGEKPKIRDTENFVKTGDLTANIKKEDGAVFIDNIPMVDQGEKGYCAAATIARILQYFGRDADMHQVAQAAGTTAESGTSTTGMEEAVDKIKGKMNLTVDKSLYELNYGGFKKLCGDYNKMAKKMKSTELSEKVQNTFSFSEFNPSMLRSVAATKNNVRKFKRAVSSNIDKGIPLVWMLELGIFPENGEAAAQDGGGHMRLITGYKWDPADPSKDELIFSDSWGKGHERKSMKLEDALSVTFKMMMIRPRGR